jgi:deoxyribose-phosphate aldolase
MKLFDDYQASGGTIDKRIERILGRTGEVQKHSVSPLQILGVLDLTTLEGSDNEVRVKKLCHQAMFSLINPALPNAAAVCVYPSLVRVAKSELHGSGIKVASVAGAFPSGQSSLHVKLEEIRFAIGEGADEIDTVISRGKLLEGKDTEVFDELSAIRETCGDLTLKVILETGELPSLDMVRKASELAILAGADFIKTSTGKIPKGAESPSFLVMLDTILEYLEKTGKSVGIKPAGGIRTREQTGIFIALLIGILGKQYFNRENFRIGASSLATDLLAHTGS